MAAILIRPSVSSCSALLLAHAVAFAQFSALAQEPSPQPPQIKATLKLDDAIAILGGAFRYSFEIENATGKPVTVMNPTAVAMPHQPMKLLLFDSTGQPLGDILEKIGNGSNGPLVSELYWKTLPPGGIIGGDRWSATAPASINRHRLAPGSYRLQLVFLDILVSDNPYKGLPDVRTVPERHNDPRYEAARKKWRDEHPGKELLRSNSVEIFVVEGK